ncbi:MAG: restriction endonuclease subunit S [Clostridia bacterium]|nr:restriction endonuclease subunit S [Clostridia bacterium]
MNTQEIRKKILSLALTGKLVEQKSSDTPAHELVESLSCSLNNHPFENDISAEEIPYEIPGSWIWCRLSDIGTTNIGLTYHPQDVAEDGTIVIRSSNIIKGKMDYADLVKVKCQIRENQYLKRNDIVICARNGSKALVGKCAIYEGGSDVISFGAFMAIFRTPFFQYAYLFFNSPVFRRNFSNDDSKQINQVTQNILKNSLIPIPPEEEQKRITDKINSVFSILDTIDTLQSQYQDNLATLKSKIIDAGIQGKLTEQLPEDGTAEELYQQIQQEKLALEKAGKIKKSKPLPPISDEEKPFDIPENWKWVKLGNVITLASGTDFKPEDYNDAGIGMPYMTGASNIENDKLIINRWTPCPRNIAHEGELLLVCKGSGFGKLVICNVSETHIARQFMSIRPYSGVDVNYVKALMTNSFQIIKEAGKGLIPGVDRDTVLNIPLPLPPLAEQKRIVAKLEELLPLCEG